MLKAERWLIWDHVDVNKLPETKHIFYSPISGQNNRYSDQSDMLIVFKERWKIRTLT